MKELKQFGIAVVNQRKRKQLSQESLSDLCQVSVRYISSVETGQANPTLKVVFRMTRALGIKVSYSEEPSDNEIEENIL